MASKLAVRRRNSRSFFKLNNGVTCNNRTRKCVRVSYDSIAKKMIICNVTLRLGGLRFQTVTSGGNSGGRGFDRRFFINEIMNYSVKHDKIVLGSSRCKVRLRVSTAIKFASITHPVGEVGLSL